MKDKIVEKDSRKTSKAFLLTLVRVVAFIVLWNSLLSAEFFRDANMLGRIIYLVGLMILVEIILQLVNRLAKR